MWLSKDGLYIQGWKNFKVKITENSGTEWDEIARETVWKIDKKALKKSNSYFYKFFW